jgi:hypothetical protein
LNPQLMSKAQAAVLAIEQFVQEALVCEAEQKQLQLVPVADPPYATKDGIQPKVYRPGKIEPRGKAPQCPECQDDMVLRTRRSNGSSFYGCVNYPTCQATVDAQQFSTRRGAMSQRG